MRSSALLRHELSRLIRARAVLVGMAVLVVASAIAVAHGSWRVRDEQAAIADLVRAHGENRDYLRSVHSPDDEIGLVSYYLWHPVANPPSPWAALAQGQRDLNPAAQKLRLLGLVPQLHGTELGNPLTAAMGGFDLTFILAFLIPLFVIGLSHDALSHDQDVGTLALVRAQPRSLFRLVGIRLLLRAALTGALVVVLIAAAAIWSGAVFSAWPTLVWACAIALLYVTIWFLVAFVVIALKRSSTFNALTLVGLWALWTIALPALMTALLAAHLPVTGGVELTLTQRQEMNRGWDKPKEATMQPFLARHPQLADAAVPRDKFSWPWYYAMHEVGDALVAADLDAYRQRIARRHQWAEAAALFLPALAVELTMSELAGTGTAQQLAHRDSIAAYHRELQGFFYPLIIAGKRLAEVADADMPQHRPRLSRPSGPPAGLAGLGGLLAALAIALPWVRRRLDEAE